jgi:hypothetical protein
VTAEQPKAARAVSLPLIFGIVVLPIILAWFLVRPGYSKLARSLAFGWMAFIIIVGIANPPQPAADPKSSSAAQPEDPAVRTYMQRVERELRGLRRQDTFDGTSASREEIMMRAGLYGAWAQLYGDGDKLALADASAAERAEFKRLATARQVIEFPLLRQRLSELMEEALESDGYEVRIEGENRQRLILAGPLLGSSRGKEQAKRAIGDLLHLLRFKSIVFESYESENRDLDVLGSPNDNALAVFEAGRWLVRP